MKIFFPIIIFVFSTGLTFGQEVPQTSEEMTVVESEVESGVPEDEVYENVANEMCACFNTEAEGISDGMRKVIEDAGKSGTSLREVVMGHASANPEQGEIDMGIISKIYGDELMSCMSKVQSKYKDTDIDSSDEVLMEFLQKVDSCGLTYAFLLEGLRQ